jgi:hypothetical protein
MPCFIKTISNGDRLKEERSISAEHNWHSLSLHVFQRAIMLITYWVPKTKWTLYMASQMVRCFLVPNVQYGRPTTPTHTHTHKKGYFRVLNYMLLLRLYTHVNKKKGLTCIQIYVLYTENERADSEWWTWRGISRDLNLFIPGLFHHSAKWM